MKKRKRSDADLVLGMMLKEAVRRADRPLKIYQDIPDVVPPPPEKFMKDEDPPISKITPKEARPKISKTVLASAAVLTFAFLTVFAFNLVQFADADKQGLKEHQDGKIVTNAHGDRIGEGAASVKHEIIGNFEDATKVVPGLDFPAAPEGYTLVKIIAHVSGDTWTATFYYTNTAGDEATIATTGAVEY